MEGAISGSRAQTQGGGQKELTQSLPSSLLEAQMKMVTLRAQ